MNSGVRAGAARTLALVGAEQVVQPLIALLNDTDIRVSVQASLTLGLIGEPAVDALIEVFHSTNNRLTQWHAISALGQVNDPRAADIFLEALPIRDHLVRKYAVYGLAKFKDVRAVEPLIKLLSHHDGDRNEVANAAAGVLAEIGDEHAIRPIFRAIVSGNIWLPDGLGHFGEPAIKLLLLGLNAKNPKRRSAAAAVLGEIREIKAVEPLIVLLQTDPDDNVRSSAAFALGEMGDKRALVALTNALNDPHEFTRAQASRALNRLKSQS